MRLHLCQLPDRSIETLTAALSAAASPDKDNVLIIHGDAGSNFQAVVTVMEAARRAGLSQITFATQTAAQAPPPPNGASGYPSVEVTVSS